MQVIDNYAGVPKSDGGVVTLGTFDGVHLGHKQIIEYTINLAKNKYNTNSIVFTYKNHPKAVLKSAHEFYLLSTLEEKLNHFKNLNVDIVYLVYFNRDFAHLNPERFFKKYIVSLRPDALVIGREFFFGHKKIGNAEILSQLCAENNIDFYQLSAFTLNGQDISSTIIRKNLLKGDIRSTNLMLGYNYSIQGKVIAGFRMGSKIGYPTANIQVLQQKFLPCHGVYSVRAFLENQTYYGMLYIGSRPTFNHKDLSIELHLFDFYKDIYGYEVLIEFLDFVREDKKFFNVECLRSQIEKDEKIIKQMLKL